MFCEVCKTMLTRLADRSDWLVRVHTDWHRAVKDRLAGDHKFENQEAKGPHHVTRRDLFISAASGCGICVKLKERLSKKDYYAEFSIPRTDHPWLTYEFEFHPHYNDFHLQITDWTGEHDLAAFEGEPVAQDLRPNLNQLGRTCASNTGHEDILRQAHMWFSNCETHHELCKERVKVGYHPPRLLQLCEDSVQLVEAKERHASRPYATLSYCWGRNPRHLTLTSENIAIFRRGCQTSVLSKTFRDSIEFSQSLGINFLWIDSLCILQSGEGSLEDWQKHVVEMGQIYANCILNIAVDYGENAEAGCFVQRDPENIKPCIFEIPLSSDRILTACAQRVESPSPRLYQLVDALFWYDLLENTTLISRGWVHQERLFSPRIVHFGREQLSWECTELLACETFPSGFDYDLRNDTLPFALQGSSADEWYNIVQKYSAASLTNPSDKLPAIAGIGQLMCTRIGTEYVAGMLLRDMPGCLLWRYDGGSLGGIVSPYRAPSWSWASREGEIFFYRVSDRSEGGDFASVDEVRLQYTDESNEFGHLRGGFITVTGPMFGVAWTNTRTEQHFYEENFELVPLEPTKVSLPSFSCRFQFDESALVRPRPPISLLFVSYNDVAICGLLLAPVAEFESLQRWMRIGVFIYSIRHWDDQYWKEDYTWMVNIRNCLQAYPTATIKLV